MNGTECECPNDLYICDLLLGCICRQDVDCGIEEPDQQVKQLKYLRCTTLGCKDIGIRNTAIQHTD